MKRQNKKPKRGSSAAVEAPIVRHAAYSEDRAFAARLHGEDLDAVREDSLIGTSATSTPTPSLQAEEPSDDVRVPR